MASISTCCTLTPNSNSYPKPSSTISLDPSRQFHFSPRAPNDVRTQFLTLRKQNHVSNSRSFVSKIRAGGNDPSKQPPAVVRNLVMDAIDKCGRRVTAGEVATMAGIKLTVAERALQDIVADYNGYIEVSKGGIHYVFPEDYRSKFASKLLCIKAEQKTKSGVAEYLIKVTFGTALLASIVIVYTTIIAILTSRR